MRRAQVYQYDSGSWTFEIVDGDDWGFGAFYPSWREAFDAACADLLSAEMRRLAG